jgi:dynein heavy chain 1
MRDIVKKKRERAPEDGVVWIFNFSHKKLQERMQHMVKFRRQHEQLRTVIVRVLRPTLA